MSVGLAREIVFSNCSIKEIEFRNQCVSLKLLYNLPLKADNLEDVLIFLGLCQRWETGFASDLSSTGCIFHIHKLGLNIMMIEIFLCHRFAYDLGCIRCLSRIGLVCFPGTRSWLSPLRTTPNAQERVLMAFLNSWIWVRW